MPDTIYIASAIAIMAATTFALRAVPFALLRPLRSSALVAYLGVYLPAGIMAILVLYSLRDVSIAAPAHGIPEVLAVAATVGVHLWKKNAVLSIIGGTVLYVALVNYVF
ncbi:putative branched-chain amino acid transport protein [Rhodococcoides trifolii]|uniref:Branched-chain amino acid transport protein n=1 Tax=Rhodococcoides trifolii TaxID=908250 RepID=A0A917CMB2_9NOCA|nr:AzlD domain-containing protein [Rhodococcus trifolii]GGF91955.1 putative branched-chain amino acid transport protein [Rhodococcus trifolii]